MSRANRTALFWGTLLVLLGLIFLLNNFNLVPASLVQWWPVLVLAAGLLLFGSGLAERQGGALITGTLLVSLSGFWLLNNLGLVEDRLFMPILLIALGAGLLLRNLLLAGQ
jgi:hypothetical protein